VDVIVTHNTPPIVAAKQATSVIPIVFASAADPVGTGLGASLGRPGGNGAGLSSQGPDAAGKRIGLLGEIIPGLRRLALLANVGNAYVALEVPAIEDAARTIGVEVGLFDIRRPDDITPAFEHLKGSAEALYIVADPLLFNNRLRINTLALGARVSPLSILTHIDATNRCISFF